MPDLDENTKADGATTPNGSLRARRARRALDRKAVRSEFETERPSRLAALRAFVANFEELERARLRALDAATRLSSVPTDVTADRPRAKSR
jgi:hypothetical protein